MTEYRGRGGARGDDPPTEPIPVVPALPNAAVPATPVSPWPLPAGTAGPALEGVVLSELESEYVARHFEYQRRAAGRAAADQGKAVQVRRAAPLMRRPRPEAPALRRAVSVVRRGTGRPST